MAEGGDPQEARRSTARIPGSLVAFLVAGGAGLLATAVYLERNHLGFLLAHPILANLISGLIGFCFGVVALSVVLGRLVSYFAAVEGSVNRRVETLLAAVLSGRRRHAAEDWVPEQDRAYLRRLERALHLVKNEEAKRGAGRGEAEPPQPREP